MSSYKPDALVVALLVLYKILGCKKKGKKVSQNYKNKNKELIKLTDKTIYQQQ